MSLDERIGWALLLATVVGLVSWMLVQTSNYSEREHERMMDCQARNRIYMDGACMPFTYDR